MYGLCMVKLSQQIQTRPTRTQRVIAEEERRREAGERVADFEKLKKEAIEISESEEFKKLSINEFQQFRGGLRPEIKQFFPTVQTLRQEQQGRIVTNTQRVEERIKLALSFSSGGKLPKLFCSFLTLSSNSLFASTLCCPASFILSSTL